MSKDQPLLVLDLSKAWSPEARAAAAEARRGSGSGQRSLDLQGGRGVAPEKPPSASTVAVREGRQRPSDWAKKIAEKDIGGSKGALEYFGSPGQIKIYERLAGQNLDFAEKLVGKAAAEKAGVGGNAEHFNEAGGDRKRSEMVFPHPKLGSIYMHTGEKTVSIQSQEDGLTPERYIPAVSAPDHATAWKKYVAAYNKKHKTKEVTGL